MLNDSSEKPIHELLPIRTLTDGILDDEQAVTHPQEVNDNDYRNQH